ncbi:PREDICTED: dnaJ homolog subfamily B member 4-like [Populus euphratica]|uniref:DnaJ homolog subfamily B member 4-like n=1 Tax=Populus euphratica TaxID=75702 RepID=A0AAJ6X8R4_POPEU|nr:PREDICTED: dnaJ homolog subfamily B member 4-like [Populus euphratica]
MTYARMLREEKGRETFGLGDPQKAAVYDQYGEEGLKDQAHPPGAGSAGASFFSAADGPTSFRGGSRGMRGTRFPGGMFGNGILFGDGIFNFMVKVEGQCIKTAPRKAAPIRNMLHCSLEEPYKGASKRMKISRETFDDWGRVLRISFYVNYLSPWFVSEV